MSNCRGPSPFRLLVASRKVSEPRFCWVRMTKGDPGTRASLVMGGKFGRARAPNQEGSSQQTMRFPVLRLSQACSWNHLSYLGFVAKGDMV